MVDTRRKSQIIVSGTSDRLMRVKYSRDDYQLLVLGTGTLKKRNMVTEYKRFEASGVLLASRPVERSDSTCFMFKDHAFSPEDAPEGFIGSRAWEEAGEAYGLEWNTADMK